MGQDKSILSHTHIASTCTACLSYRDMEFIDDVLGLGGSDVLPFVEALCWFCSLSVSIGADDTVLNILSYFIQSKALYLYKHIFKKNPQDS